MTKTERVAEAIWDAFRRSSNAPLSARTVDWAALNEAAATDADISLLVDVARVEARSAMGAISYRDSEDEKVAIEVARRVGGIDAAGAIEIFDTWIAVLLDGTLEDEDVARRAAAQHHVATRPEATCNRRGWVERNWRWFRDSQATARGGEA